MADNLNGWRFERGLDQDFMGKLKLLAQTPGWFADVLADPDLILGIRKNYMNVYRFGQSVFKIERNGKEGPLTFTTHPKYLVDPDLDKPVPFNGTDFEVKLIEPLIKTYAGASTLARMKRAATPYHGDEKHGVHAVAVAPANENVIDTEVAFSCKGAVPNKRSIPRVDLACFEDVHGGIRLRFWEAKLYDNSEIRAAADTTAQVVEQIMRYRGLVQEHRKEVLESYRLVARNLAEIVSWPAPREDGEWVRKVGTLVQRVAAGEPVTIDEPPFVGLIIYGYDEGQAKSERWKAHLGKLKKEANIPIRTAGNAKNIRLRGGDAE